MTYPNNKEYKNEMKSLLDSNELSYMIFENYLDDYSVLNIRKAIDFFIHVQSSDTYSGSVQEYLLAGAKVINAYWIKYYRFREKRYSVLCLKNIR